VGFESAINFLKSDSSQYLPEFIKRMSELDEMRNETMLDVIPELDELTK